MNQPIELEAAVCTTVRLRGTIRRTKRADVLVLADGREVECGGDVRFPDDRVDTPGEAEGVLVRRTVPAATVDATGAWSQGPTHATEVWVLEGCRIV